MAATSGQRLTPGEGRREVEGVVVPGPEDVDEETWRLRESIAHTRAELGSTLEALQEKLNPTVLAGQAKSAVRDATIGKVERKVENMVHSAESRLVETGSSFTGTLRRHPIAAAVAGFSLAWLWAKGRSERRYRGEYREIHGREGERGHGGERMYGERVYGGQRVYGGERGYSRGERPYSGEQMYSGDSRRAESRSGDEREGIAESIKQKAGEVVHRVEDATERAKDAIGGVSHDAGETVKTLAHEAKERSRSLATDATERGRSLAHEAMERGRRMEHRAEDVFHENPLAVGAVALAAGTAIGLAIPRTRREDELMGKARDQVVEKVGEMAQDAMGKVQEKAREIGENVQSAAPGSGQEPSSITGGQSAPRHA